MKLAGSSLARRPDLHRACRKVTCSSIPCAGSGTTAGLESDSKRSTGAFERSLTSSAGITRLRASFQESLERNRRAGYTNVKDMTVRGGTARHQSSAVHVCEGEAALYDEERHARFGAPSHKALLVDAAGTLLIPTQPAAKVYRELGLRYGVTYSENEILARYRRAYAQPWYHSRLRYVDDGRPFWKFVVSEATGCADEEYFNELYNYYSTADAWRLLDPESEKVFASLRDAGVKLAVVSNFDTRLRSIMRRLNCDHWFDILAVSAEVNFEKPNPTIFLHACEQLGVEPRDTVHVGDDRRNDVWGARDAGCDAWLWGYDVNTFREVAERIGVDVDARRH